MWTQPILTANGTIGTSEFAVASGGGADSDAYKAFDNSDSSYVNKMNSGAWLKFFSQTWLVISDIVITSKGSLPSQGIFQVSCDNGVTWQQCGSWQDSDALGESAHVVIDSGSVTGQFFRFVSQGKSLAKPNNNADFCNVIITADIADELPLSLIVDVERNVRQSRTPVAKYLSFTGNSGCYGELPLDVLAGASTFTIEAKFSTTSTVSKSNNYQWATIVGKEIGGTWQNDFGLCVNGGKLCFWAEPKSGGSSSTCNTTSNAIVNDGAIHEVAVVSADGAIDLYCDGKLVAHTENVNAKITDAYKILIAYNSDSNSRLQMDLYELRCWNVARSEIFADIDGTEDGLQAWYLPSDDGLLDYSGNERHATLYGSPTLNDVYYLPVNFSADVERKVKNIVPVEFTADVERKLLVKWRYVNAGTADTLTVTGTTLTGLPETKSVTGTAFYQTSREKCFDIPATPEIWIKFDVYFDGSARWRAYNDRTGELDSCGITAQTNGDLSFFANDSNVQQFSDVCKKNQLQTVLLHMTAGSSDGVIEAWVDGERIYTYTGDVNHGENFSDIYLQSGGAGTFFSNVIISNVEVGLGDGYQIFSADVERKVKNIVEETFDVHITAPIVVPLIGEHFNHYARNITVYNGSPQKIILPRKGDVWISGIVAFQNKDTEIFTADGQSFYFSESPDIHFVDVDEIFIGDNYYGDDFVTFDEILISDGDGNTRQIFSADIERKLIKTSENVFDVKFVDVVPVEFTADVSRNILTTLHYFETDNSEYLSGGASAVTLPTQEFIPPMEETGLQSIEITLQEQQLTDQVKVVGVIPFDIMFPVRGQYLDYVYDMRVEKVQQQGILYSADCCIDIDEALYTQFNYSLDSDEDFIYFVPDYDSMTLVEVDHYAVDWEEIALKNQGLRKGFASKHFAKIANLLGKNYVCQFEDFASNMQERQSDVTFGDLISQLFGWSSRLPQRMINCYLRDDTLFAVQRGYERNVIDLTNAERTLPTFNRQLMRTFWGSGTALIEPTTEKETVDNRVTFGGMKVYPWPPTSSPDGKTSYVYKNVSGYPGIETGYALESTTTRNDDGGKTVVSYGYDTVNNVYTCVSETSTTYDADGKKVDKKTTYHDRLTRSQQFTRVDDEDGNTVGSNVGSNLPGYYNESYWLHLPYEVGSEDEIDKITGFNPLVDTEFPVCDPKVYPELINAYIWLNRRTQETVTFSLYNCPHLIDFNDRIVLEGNEYFLVRNIAKTTPRLYNEQNLTLVRWF